MRSRSGPWVVASLLLAAGGFLLVGAKVLTQAPPDRELIIVAKGMAFRIEGLPLENPDIRLAEGQRVVLRFRNQDPGVEHELGIPALGIRTEVLEYGQEASFVLVPRKAGQFLYRCVLHPAMMQGKLLVER